MTESFGNILSKVQKAWLTFSHFWLINCTLHKLIKSTVIQEQQWVAAYCMKLAIASTNTDQSPQMLSNWYGTASFYQ